jgi:hypothetical protein
MKKIKTFMILLPFLTMVCMHVTALDQPVNSPYNLFVTEHDMEYSTIHGHVNVLDPELKFFMVEFSCPHGFLEAGLNYSDDDGHGMVGGISWNPSPGITFSGGYKALDLDWDGNGLKVETKSAGPFMNLELSF